MDEIRIKGLKVYAYHGVFAQEKNEGQNFIVNAVLHTDTKYVARRDDYNEATDYSKVCTTIESVMTETKYDLIETVAEKVAEKILLTYAHIKAVDIEVCKPEAPMPMEVENVSVKIHRAWHNVYIAYGSNMGDSEGYIDDAMEAFDKHEQIKVKNDSTRILTKPYGPVEQDDFINGVCHIKTIMSPEELLKYLHILEQHANRVRDIHWGPRTLDLDIIMYDDLVYESEDLIIPHVDMENRDFVLKPLMEIAPNMRHPILKKTITQLYNALEEKTENKNV
ncbi:MAG: 2-amino-4-hydroxy-6-hydroxymethyldihydropteridine diphosphokinase [Lachnospiraceae bacterium]|nr:2-amino-4-hydroxy-6-hydroxymethyldihydropteridine diphosphokinase [Candidatus Colinaster equi]